MYEHYARNIYIPFDGALGYHPEYSGYENGWYLMHVSFEGQYSVANVLWLNPSILTSNNTIDH